MIQPVARRVLLGGIALGSAMALITRESAHAANAAVRSNLLKRPRPTMSANGWPVSARANDATTVWTRPVSGTALQVDITVGDPEVLLVHVVRRIHYEIRSMLPADLTGWRPFDRTNRHRPESNLSSGTAVRVRPGARSDAYYPLEELALRDILADCEGLVRWGGDDVEPDQSLFYLDVGPHDDRLAVVAQRLRRAAETPGEGPGTIVSYLEPGRRRRATAVQRGQRDR